jgi:hypothetical protein
MFLLLIWLGHLIISMMFFGFIVNIMYIYDFHLAKKSIKIVKTLREYNSHIKAIYINSLKRVRRTIGFNVIVMVVAIVFYSICTHNDYKVSKIFSVGVFWWIMVLFALLQTGVVYLYNYQKRIL